ncbi:MAG: NAD(P)-dependent alcohol dehydrogenase [Deferribacteraceae bacterium]|jgi:L-iditol 2-dehydrogenase|nr:NAD(P)-dependent alcohol dehydrogenase [Deferribacteraceae bacterium]
MKGKMKVAVMTGLGKMDYVERDIPQPKAHEVLVKLEYVGVCGSDLHYYEHGQIGPYIVKPPFVLGHEPGGVVAEVGANVKHLKVGDKVAVEPGIPCGHCELCREGKYNLCPDVFFLAAPPIDGAFQEYIAHDAAFCFKLPDSMSTMEGAMIEPFAVGLHAARQGHAQAGQTAVVFGAGCIGLMSMLAFKVCGVSKVYQVDVVPKRLDKAKELGATEIINAKDVDPIAKVNELTGGRGCDLVLDTSGTEIAYAQAVEMLRKAGTFVAVGYSKSGMVNVPMSNAMDKELNIATVSRYRHVYPMAIEAVASGKANIKGVVTDVFSFDDMQNAMDRSVADKMNIVKSVIKIG